MIRGTYGHRRGLAISNNRRGRGWRGTFGSGGGNRGVSRWGGNNGNIRFNGNGGNGKIRRVLHGCFRAYVRISGKCTDDVFRRPGACYIKHNGDDNAVYCFMENGTIYNNGNMGFIPRIIRQRVERGSFIRSKRGKEYGEPDKSSF